MARRGRGRRTTEMVKVASERIEVLFDEADRAALEGRFELADRYVELARRVGMRYNVRVPSHMKRRFCSSCHGYLLPGVTSRNRLKRGHMVTTCLRCGHVMRLPIHDRPLRRGPAATDGGTGGGEVG